MAFLNHTQKRHTFSMPFLFEQNLNFIEKQLSYFRPQ